MIDWPIAFSTIAQAVKLANELRSIDKEASQAELKLKIADLTSALADLKITLTDAKREAGEKDGEIARLKKLQQRVADDTVELLSEKCARRFEKLLMGKSELPTCATWRPSSQCSVLHSPISNFSIFPIAAC
jgi:hypothetical protein